MLIKKVAIIKGSIFVRRSFIMFDKFITICDEISCKYMKPGSRCMDITNDICKNCHRVFDITHPINKRIFINDRSYLLYVPKDVVEKN